MPAIKEPKSKEYNLLSLSLLGTLSSRIALARPRVIAVFPTPASPKCITLLFSLRQSILIVLSISLSRPTSGSLWCLAISIKSVQQSLKICSFCFSLYCMPPKIPPNGIPKTPP